LIMTIPYDRLAPACESHVWTSSELSTATTTIAGAEREYTQPPGLVPLYRAGACVASYGVPRIESATESGTRTPCTDARASRRWYSYAASAMARRAAPPSAPSE